jgi:hypothetical protein
VPGKNQYSLNLARYGNMTLSSQNTQTKIYVDGFCIDTIETPRLCDNLKEVALTDKVKELLEDRKITTIAAVPTIKPKFIMIITEY